jgi:lipid-A-disaccharide synthase
MRYFIIAGETSGDLHGSGLMRELAALDEHAEFMGMGGDKMVSQGLNTVVHIDKMNFMGFYEVLNKLRQIRQSLKSMKHALTGFKPDHIILIDYGGFNLRMAKFAHKAGLRVHYYILPKVWAWNEGRIKKISRYVRKAYVIFPFEEGYFKKGGIDVEYCGNPSVEGLANFLNEGQKDEVNPHQIALLPGSRKQEIDRILPVMLSITKAFSNYQFVIAVGSQNCDIPQNLPKNVTIVTGSTYSVVRSSSAAIVTSGTANLETAILNTPQIVVYKANPLSYWIGKMVVKIKYISPVNLILNRTLCKELIQYECNKVNLSKSLEECLDEANAAKIRNGYAELRTLLGSRHPSAEIAKRIVAKKL